MKSAIRKITPKWVLSLYHYLFAIFSNLVFLFPSRKMLVIGITGTKGKTSSSNLIWSVLRASGIKTGLLSTAYIRIGEVVEDNNFHMTMPGRFFVQRNLSRMRKAGCKVAVVETTSQGILQYRHVGISYDLCIFTNLTPEHIDSHGSFEKYREAKGKMFEAMGKYRVKKWKEKDFPKTILANIDDDSAQYFLGFNADLKKTYSLHKDSDFKAENVVLTESGSKFNVNDEVYEISLPGEFNVYNALPAIASAKLLGAEYESIKAGLKSMSMLRGRMEEIPNDKGFRVFVDYAHEPAGLQSAIETANHLKKSGSKSIVLVGAAGGGRDKARRATMGSTAGMYADIVVVSDDEPYEEDPALILEAIKNGAVSAGKKEDEDLFVIGDRREGIRKALSVAKEGDVVIFTGLGHQNVRMIGKKAVSWTDQKVAKEELQNI